ncbi:MAG TPA: HisA/HisF-related TIM barrel protein [Candidatus Methanoculleus thermohydrogenotrophicum]|jgi:phosphoribosylformimino-5-aminoimidazole carboxamide ribotide isomerase|nr:HisA/HisF-related TIM barrel protein [Candidatus Methanoculleus thermohydrogenotrophicum]NLM82614.1 nickel transporter [Candidatus Methanoculleus thermohydrogenotrophicum]HOB18250.1 HisA/HisF-related TIM barrel protein [Candidatus Methanoculleus thermohydrogenotrophicum]HPZ38373.1 HisA/HisF-related TIM barrel protein [Candidatus Methanoculleus thermohydrogenotrophicum]HQC91601.1 HisA/HisF-related TIM barrel protein [Candidatus Methanoculleus thermohydrogenotrophicum]
MELILALDLAGGLVVHGKSGNRAGYRPLSWGLAPSAEPETYLSVMRPRFLYIADLESIQGRTPQDDLVRRCAALVERCYLDRGFRSSAECAAVDGVTPVVGTETAAATIKDLREYQTGYLSIDIKGGRVLPWGIRPTEMLRRAAEMSFEGCIILNIEAVGTEQGLVWEDLEEMRACYPGRLFYGGGVAGVEDIHLLADTGFDGAIIATAVHRGGVPLDWIQRGHPC